MHSNEKGDMPAVAVKHASEPSLDEETKFGTDQATNGEAVSAAAAAAGFGGRDGSQDSRDGVPVIKLLAHTAGGISVQQAVLNHMTQHPPPRQEVGSSFGTKSDYDIGRFSDSHQRPCVKAAAEPVQVSSGGSSARRKPVVVLAIGPEGGWTHAETAVLTKQHAFQVVTIANRRTLDTTTAVISLISLVFEAVQSGTNLDLF